MLRNSGFRRVGIYAHAFSGSLNALSQQKGKGADSNGYSALFRNLIPNARYIGAGNCRPLPLPV